MKNSLLVLLGSLVLFAACGGQVKFEDGQDNRKQIAAKKYKFKTVKIVYSKNAMQKLMRYKNFKQAKLLNTVKEYFNKQGLISGQSDYTIQFQVRDLFLRSTAKAFLLPISDPDKVDVVVTVKSASGQEVERFKVDSSYSLGGTSSALPQVRTTLLFKHLSQLVSDVFTGKNRESDF